MKTQKTFTKVYDYIFDELLKALTGAEVKVLLIIVRKSIGWQKDRCPLRIYELSILTGLSKRAVSGAIASLSEQNIITITNAQKIKLSPSQRKQSNALFYQLSTDANTALPHAKKDTRAMQKLHTYNREETKKKESSSTNSKRKTDSERIAEILGKKNIYP